MKNICVLLLLYSTASYGVDQDTFVHSGGDEFRFIYNDCRKSLDECEISKYEDVRDENGQGFMHWAVKNNDVKMVEHLIENGFDVNPKNKDGQTPISLVLRDLETLFESLGIDVVLGDKYWELGGVAILLMREGAIDTRSPIMNRLRQISDSYDYKKYLPPDDKNYEKYLIPESDEADN